MARTQVLSFGGGVQSAAICVLIAQGRLPKPDLIVMSDTGREATATWDYLHAAITPLLATVGLEVEVASHNLATVDLYSGNGDVLMPMYTDQSGARGKLPTYCSNEWKKRVVMRYLRSKGVRECDNWLGFSLDEIERCKPSGVRWLHQVYPLIDGLMEPYVPWGHGAGLSMSRADCVRLVEDAGLPTPPKSSCLMCPHRRNGQWRDLRDNYPDDFTAAVLLERELREKDPHVYLHESLTLLDQADLTGPDRTDSQCSLGLCFV